MIIEAATDEEERGENRELWMENLLLMAAVTRLGEGKFVLDKTASFVLH